ncbi:Maltose phosphorylase [Operophtera brumata]|uniref:Maltose phosphorylase n=1 Tax=Operophtera brumata TaxID=104452 RepID=A0A0L7KVK0_OPEBR|nr:Maltose phosphorylase [Operophtera brumata]
MFRFPWERTYTGVEVTQPCCPEVAEFEQHISRCIAFAARQFPWERTYTGVEVTQPCCPEVAEFEQHISRCIAFAARQYVSCLCKSYFLAKDPEHYADIAWSLALPYDESFNYHPQFSGYTRGESIKQADAVLLGFPLQYTMNVSTRANDLSYYESVTRSNGPAMAWSMHAIGHLQLGEEQQAEANFNKSYQAFVREPFKVWSELARPSIGAVNFFTGMGGFLQTLMFGYAGVSIHLDKLQIDKPRLPPGATRFKIQGIKYVGAKLTLEIDKESTTLKVSSVDDKWPLSMFNGKYNVTLVPVELTGEGPFPITARPWKDCKIPADVIGNNNLRPIGA